MFAAYLILFLALTMVSFLAINQIGNQFFGSEMMFVGNAQVLFIAVNIAGSITGLLATIIVN